MIHQNIKKSVYSPKDITKEKKKTPMTLSTPGTGALP
jgi:hypothetical protein